MGEHSPPLRGHAARGCWAGSQSHGSNHRHPEREDYGERWPARLGRRKAAERAQAAYRGGHGRAVARHSRPCGRHSGCRWPGRSAEAPETPLCLGLRAVFADSIYNRLAALLACYLAGLVLIIVRPLAGTTGFVVLPRRWVVERSLGWFGRWRRLSKDYETLPEVPRRWSPWPRSASCCTASPTPIAGSCPPHNFQGSCRLPG